MKITITNINGGKEELNLITAFKDNNNTYVVLDNGTTGSMGLPIIFVSKLLNNQLEKISDTNEWQAVKNCLKGIIGGTNFEYVKVDANLTGTEGYYIPLTLPQASYQIIKDRYKIEETPNVLPPQDIPVPPAQPMPSVTPSEVAPAMPSEPAPSAPAYDIPTSFVSTPVAQPAAPVNASPAIDLPTPPAQPMPSVTPSEVAPTMPEAPTQPTPSAPAPSYNAEKETFMKACENMFDALNAKIEAKIQELDAREAALAQKEEEINAKLYSANEALANATAREQVANIAHDNAQKVMASSGVVNPIAQ